MNFIKSQATFFGKRKVDSSDDKQSLVSEVFSSVASKYDIMNDVMSFGIHRLWKKRFVGEIANPNSRIIDVASGTGDIALKIHQAGFAKHGLVLSDINKDMLDKAKDKFIDRGIIKNIEYCVADASSLPFPDNSFDYYTISFGIRNVARLDLALKEAFRILKPMGKFLCLEFSKPTNEILDVGYRKYSEKLIPLFGELIVNDRASYDYLIESIEKFPDQDTFKTLIEEAGFAIVSYENLSLGIAAIHKGFKID